MTTKRWFEAVACDPSLDDEAKLRAARLYHLIPLSKEAPNKGKDARQEDEQPTVRVSAARPTCRPARRRED